VISLDSDQAADATPSEGSHSVFDGWLGLIGRTFAGTTAAGPDKISVGGTTVRICEWSADDPPQPGIPRQQTLERLLCAAIVAAYPNRAQPVQTWLDGRPDAPTSRHPREHAWSFAAGWYADRGDYAAVCAGLWKDERIKRELINRLSRSEIWALAEQLAQ
jgi:hypothetical protein